MYTAVLHKSPGRILMSAENLGEIEKSEFRVIIFTQDVCSDFVTRRVTRLHLRKKIKKKKHSGISYPMKGDPSTKPSALLWPPLPIPSAQWLNSCLLETEIKHCVLTACPHHHLSEGRSWRKPVPLPPQGSVPSYPHTGCPLSPPDSLLSRPKPMESALSA